MEDMEQGHRSILQKCFNTLAYEYCDVQLLFKKFTDRAN